MRASTTFLVTVSDRLRSLATITELLVPYDRGDVLASVHREGEVVSTAHESAGVRVRARLAEASVGRLAPVRGFAGLTRSGSMAGA